MTTLSEATAPHPTMPVPPEDGRSRYLDLARMDWETTPFPGIEAKILLDDKSTGLSTMLLRLAPGAVVPDHVHQAIEQTFVLEGSLDDHEGSCTAGNFVWRPAGSRHEAVSPNGALILSFFTAPNKFFGGQPFFTDEDAAGSGGAKA
jgi:anti-sigma factor ChrR (cupin superfamily)